jgi:hypothetical protein
MGVRLYAPTIGRFLSDDPVHAANPNAYTYPVDPIGSSDLTGACPWCAGLLAVGVALDWSPVGWVITGVAVVAGVSYAGYQAYQAYDRTRGNGVVHMGKRPARNAGRNGHRTTKNGKSGSDRHTSAQGHGGRAKPNFKPNPNKRWKADDN